MQTRVRVGAYLPGKKLENEVTEPDMENMMEEDPDKLEDEVPLGLAGVDADALGALEAVGDEPTEHVDGEELGFVELEEGEDLDGTPMDIADDPNLAPHLEELMEVEQNSEYFDNDEDDAQESEDGDSEEEAKKDFCLAAGCA
jgi:hypothetical protein